MNERYTYSGHDTDFTHIHRDGKPLTCGEIVDELIRLRDALAPFAELGAKIPDNWPGQCPLRIDQGQNRIVVLGRPYEYLSYHGVNDDGKTIHCDTLLPTIGQWREANDAINERHSNEKETN